MSCQKKLCSRAFCSRYLLPLILLLSALFSGCAHLGLSGREWHTYIRKSSEQYLRSIFLRGSSWSIMAVDLQNKEVILAYDQDRTLIPGSGIKLLTTACALETLGPEYRTTTLLGYTGSIDSTGGIDGDLIVIGGGDPTIGTRFPELRSADRQADTLDVFASWSDSLYGRGIRRIDGDLVGYNGLFGTSNLGSGWEWDDLPSWYAAEFSPLVYADDCIEISIFPADSVGQPARIVWHPEVDFITIKSLVVTAAPEEGENLHFDRELAGNVITLSGTIPRDAEPERRWISVHNAGRFFLSVFRGALAERGISCGGDIRTTGDWRVNIPDFQPLFAHSSPPLRNIIRVINRYSPNLYAEMLVRLMGAELIRRGSEGAAYSDRVLTDQENAFAVGRRRIQEWNSKIAGNAPGFALADGSGLSRRDLISASGLIKVLVYMRRSPYFGDFLSSLAVSGTGTLEKRYLGLPRGVTLHAKTGSLTRVRSMSGYLSVEGEPRIAFSFICNNYLCSSDEVERTMENLCQLLALYLKER